MKPRRVIMGIGLMGLCLPAVALKATPDMVDQVATEAVESFWKAVAARKLDAVMKLVEVPWCHDGREIIKDGDMLREYFRKRLASPGDLSKTQLHVRKVMTLAQFRDAKKRPPARRVSLVEVLENRDRIVFVEVEHDGRFQPVWIGVRVKNASGKNLGVIVGLVD